MKHGPDTSKIFEDFLDHFRHDPDSVSSEPIREDVYSVERLEEYARGLAKEQTFYSFPKKGRSLNPILKRHSKDLLAAYKILVEAIQLKKPVSPAAEWIVDNFHVIEEQLNDIRVHLPAGYYNGLPKLSSGSFEGYPRVYAIALSFLAHTDCKLNTESLRRFVDAFQKDSPLSIGELWALAISLRIALLDFLKPMALRVVRSRINREIANTLADRVLTLFQEGQSTPKDIISILSKRMGKPSEFDRAFVVQLSQRLRDQDPDVEPAIEWIEEELKKIGTSSQQLMQLEHHRQAAAQVTVGNIIGSMRLLSALDWREFFEGTSFVDRILRKDPAGVYALMEFHSRDSYRHEIERLAHGSKQGEIKVAQATLDLALEARKKIPDVLRTQHVGYFLIGDGQTELEQRIKFRRSFTERIIQSLKGKPYSLYILPIFLVTAAICVLVLTTLQIQSLWVAVLLVALIIIPLSEFSIGVVNHCVTLLFKPTPLAKIDTKDGIPDLARTFVVVPTLFTSEKNVENLIERFHVNFLANRDENIFFGLLVDFKDSSQEIVPEDERLLKHAQDLLGEINARYFPKGQEQLFLFARHRQWNESENKWIGWERKRGKLEEFNKLLKGNVDTSYTFIGAPKDILATIKNVITLDSDTKLPRDAARRMIGTMIHPLNRPVLDLEKRVVTRGYGILQPRVSVALNSRSNTRFSRIFSGHAGIDPYTTAVSNVYQDLFHEGSFTGKGLYNVDAFQAALENRVPENTVLSHDLFEGSFARTALLSDIEVFDDYPENFEIYRKRLHRWTRGDWQIARWIWTTVPDATGKVVRNSLSAISKWKIFDNLRRSLIMPAFLLSFSVLWLLLPNYADVGTLFMFLLLFVPAYLPTTSSFLTVPKKVLWKGHLRNFRVDTQNVLTQTICTLIFLPDIAWTQCDAISRTLYRKVVSRKNLLEWLSFDQSQQESKKKSALGKWTGRSHVWVAINLALILSFNGGSLIYASPLLLLWIANPFILDWLSKKPSQKNRALDLVEKDTYRHYARRTWHYFESFLRLEDHWIAPDNFQLDPNPTLARRTSPTNIGLQLLAMCSARDLGYLGRLEFTENIEKSFVSIKKMERFKGHFYNWYDTQTLEPLNPRYVSSVDSGNLAGHLLAVKQSCLEYIHAPYSKITAKEGLSDTLLAVGREFEPVVIPVDDQLLVTLDQARGEHDDALKKLIRLDCKNDDLWESGLESILSPLETAEDILATLAISTQNNSYTQMQVWIRIAIKQVEQMLRDHRNSDNLEGRLLDLANTCDELFEAMDFSFLFDKQRKTFSIGYNVTDDRNDNSFYDLLASESRLTSFIAISKGDVPQEHWFRLGRPLTKVKSGRALISWTATMFEYFMPLLVMFDYEDTLLNETYASVLSRQIEYGKKNKVPWGISEAAYNARDLQLNYQYGPFGIPGLGLKRGLSDDLVVSPYSTFLGALISPHKALLNLQHFEKIGMFSRFGFFESIDYTPSRLPLKKDSFIIQSHMAHHQGMSLVAINNILNNGVMQKRFHSDTLVQSSELLLQEKIPQDVSLTRPRAEEVHAEPASTGNSTLNTRIFSKTDLSSIQTQTLSNGNYSTMVTSSGSGYSRCGNLAVNRWREDSTRDHWGQFIYIRNRSNQDLWSAGYMPTAKEATKYEAIFSEDRIDILRKDNQITTHTEIIVSPEDNVELRQVSIKNNSIFPVEIEITSFAEVVLAPQLDDIAHPAFSNLFVQTEYKLNSNALIATRRKRSENDSDSCCFHVVTTEGTSFGVVQYETDRSRFLGRGRTSANPLVIEEQRPLSDTTGSVLDPIFSLRSVVFIKGGETSKICFSTGVATSREEALRLCEKYHDPEIFSREAELAWTKAHVQLRHLDISTDKAHTYQNLASHIIYSNPSLRPRPSVLAQNTMARSGLWTYGISGDIPIVLTVISNEKDMSLVREFLHAHEYLRIKGLVFDLVILNERPPSYFQSLQDELQKQIRICGSKALINKAGGVFLLRTEQMPKSDILLLKAAARVSLKAGKGSLSEQLNRIRIAATSSALLSSFEMISPLVTTKIYPDHDIEIPKLKFFNGLGGFANDGSQYCIHLKDNQWTPAPWINVIANEKDFGFLISEAGSGYTWSENSRENRLSTWSNDAVSDPPSECVYIRDDESGEYWSPTPLPIREKEAYLVTHSQGATRFEHISHGLQQTLDLFVPVHDRVKITRLTLENLTKDARSLSIFNYVDWVLGFDRSNSSPFVITDVDVESQAILARNPSNNEFSSRIAFVQVSEAERSYTCDRKEFIGPKRALSNPLALERKRLSNSHGAGLDPCTAIQHKIKLEPGEKREVFFLLGQGEDIEEVQKLLKKYSTTESVQLAYEEALSFWKKLLGKVQIKTPESAMNILVNNWLPYQNLSCRIWARTAFYQSGGAFGFRDQLQDVMALVYSSPDITRKHILRAAAHQFIEGDVQHWWHPPTGRGVRTRFSDDLLWLAFVTSFYIKNTGDLSILNEEVSFLKAPMLAEGVSDSYTQPERSSETATLLEHCSRAIDRSLAVGSHGLPLMGSGDWNDGMNKVGDQGQGESVWVAWFLYTTIEKFLPYLEQANGQELRIEKYKQHLIDLKIATEKNAWDGDWYKRAFFDDGTPIGSSGNDECRIDSIAQSWAVLSGAADPERAKRAMSAVEELLVQRGDGLIKLFTPPFDKGALNPGYIKGYVPGVRENGGQYTHAALWVLMAFAKLGDGDKATELYGLLNPISHSSSRAGLHKYKVEPYVAAADVYGLWPHVGRGGWTWYTGSASWMYRASLESILGFDLNGDVLRIQPAIPSLWNGYEISFMREKNTSYHVSVFNLRGKGLKKTARIELDGTLLDSNDILLVSDGAHHEINIEI